VKIGNNTTVGISTDLGIDLGGLAGIPAWAVAAFIALLLLVILILLLWRWRRLKVIPGSPTVPSDGKTALPVKVMFVNGFGMKRRPRTNIDVEMDATSGSIQNVVLPISRDYVEAMLVPSKEFGPVTITAKAGKKKAKASVSFVCEGAALDVKVSPETMRAGDDTSASVSVRVRDKNGNYAAPMQDMAIGLTSTLGKIASGIVLTARSSEAVTMMTPGDKSGTAVITAVSGPMRGEGRLNVQGIARRFCMHCGTAMTMEASRCPKCGLTPPSGVDVKQCPTCGTVIPSTAKYCHSCGVAQ
jgi:hypothetical protein